MQNKSKHMGGQCCSLVQLDCIHLQGPGGGRETEDLCPPVTHAALGLMLMENEMFKSLAEKWNSL